MKHTQSTAHPDCLIDLNRMITKEGNGACSIFDTDWKVLDLDALEIKLKKTQRRHIHRKTCDFAAGIRENNAEKMLLVECRLRYKKPNNLSAAELSGKIEGSMELLGHTLQIHQSVFFIFANNVKSGAFRRLRELESNRKKYLAVTVEEFRNLFTIPCSTECRDTTCASYT